MNIEKEKLEIINWIITLKDDVAIEKLKMLKNDQKNTLDWWGQIGEEEKEAIEKGLEDIKAGRVAPHQEVKRLYEKYL